MLYEDLAGVVVFTGDIPEAGSAVSKGAVSVLIVLKEKLGVYLQREPSAAQFSEKTDFNISPS